MKRPVEYTEAVQAKSQYDVLEPGETSYAFLWRHTLKNTDPVDGRVLTQKLLDKYQMTMESTQQPLPQLHVKKGWSLSMAMVEQNDLNTAEAMGNNLALKAHHLLAFCELTQAAFNYNEANRKNKTKLRDQSLEQIQSIITPFIAVQNMEVRINSKPRRPRRKI